MGWLKSYPEQAAMWQKYVAQKGGWHAAVPGNKSHVGFFGSDIDTIYSEPWHFDYDLLQQELTDIEAEPISAEDYMKSLM